MDQSLGSNGCLGRYCAEAKADGRQRRKGMVPGRSQWRYMKVRRRRA